MRDHLRDAHLYTPEDFADAESRGSLIEGHGDDHEALDTLRGDAQVLRTDPMSARILETDRRHEKLRRGRGKS
jgi:hypothetical protein